MDYEPVIGLEVHVQIRTASKMFCACANEFGADPNTRTCPVCLGLPGTLPTPNIEAVRRTIATGLMLGCDIAPICKFDRKSYFYPDMPKNYQISQYDLPLCLGGGLELDRFSFPKDAQKSPAAQAKKRVRLTRIHLEEDVAKSTHFDTASGIDFNRAGTPLMEIVTRADISSPEEAFAFLSALRTILRQGGVSDADMEKGQLRCDCNISVRPTGQEKFGTKVEIKNMNSFSGVRRALAFEIDRQVDVVRSGGAIRQETRGWDDAAGRTFPMRSKEQEHDYRYFPCPDLMPIRTDTGLLDDARAMVPELPAGRRARYETHLGLNDYDAAVLAADLDLAAYFERAAAAAEPAKPKAVANYVINDLLGALEAAGIAPADCPVQPAALGSLARAVDSGQINSKQAKEVFAEMFQSGADPASIIRDRGLTQVSDEADLEKFAREAIAANPESAAAFKAGKTAAANKIKGAAIKLSSGKANPQAIGAIIERLLSSE